MNGFIACFAVFILLYLAFAGWVTMRKFDNLERRISDIEKRMEEVK